VSLKRVVSRVLALKEVNMSKIGYARVSTTGQNLDSQIDMLTATGCVKIFTDKISGIKTERQGWDSMLEYLRPGDTVVVTELSRMTRSLMHLLEVVKEFEERGFHISSMRENIDTSTATGRAFLHIIGAINQMERELRAERSAAGREAAKARGKTGGRPRTDPAKLEQAKILYENSDRSAQEICDSLGIGRRTFFRYISK
jgi:DNA invertase Pin-like site-specific DNA recombinase